MSINNDSNWDFSDIPLRDRQNGVHFFHHYTAKFIPQIPEKFIRKYGSGNDIILDPFMGSGTTLIVAKLLQKPSIGIDTNPLAVKIVKAKTLEITSSIEKELDDFLQWIRKLKEIEKRNPFDPGTEECNTQLFVGSNDWFRDDVALKINSITNFSKKYSDLVQNYIQVGLSDLLRGMSNARMDNNVPTIPDTPIYIDRKHYYREVNNLTRSIPVYSRLESQIKRMKSASISFNNNSDSTISCLPVLGDSRELSKFVKKCDLVFTSPPYWSAQNYQKLHVLSFKLFGLSISQEDEIGRNGNKKYQDDMFKVNLELAKVLKGYYGLVIGEDTKNEEHLKVLDGVKKAGFKHIESFTRTLSNQTFFSKKIQREYIYVFQRI